MVPIAVGFIVAIGYAIAFRKYKLHHQWTFTVALPAPGTGPQL